MSSATFYRRSIGVVFLAVLLAGEAACQQPAPLATAGGQAGLPTDIMPDAEWRRVDRAVDRGVLYLVRQQAPDGSFPTGDNGQPGVTALALLALLSHGHEPGQGPYGQALSDALGFVLECQRGNGLISRRAFDGPVKLTETPLPIGRAGVYNHAIASLALSESYGIVGRHDEELKDAIERALQATLAMQAWPKRSPAERGGWRYLDRYDPHDADLSLASWNIKFYRSAKNNGFDVPDKAIKAATGFVLRCFTPELHTFEYKISENNRRTRAMAGAGILALAHAGAHNRPEAVTSADWILTQGFTRYNQQALVDDPGFRFDRYHYGVFYCSLAMYQIGGRHWAEFFPPTARTLVDNQNRDGSWDAEGVHDGQYGQSYTTSLALLALSAPNQLLPIYQR